MNSFHILIKSFIDHKITFKEFDSQWQKLYNKSVDSKEYELLSDAEADYLDRIHDREDSVLENEQELKNLKKYHFISVEEFRQWLKDYQEDGCKTE